MVASAAESAKVCAMRLFGRAGQIKGRSLEGGYFSLFSVKVYSK